MDTNSMVIISGLVALLVAYAAIRDSDAGWSGTVGPMRWTFSGSWASSSAVVLALVLTFLGVDLSNGMLIGLGLMMIFAPLIYKGMGDAGGASKPVFFIVSAVMTWGTLGILYVAATKVPIFIGSLPILPTVIIEASLVLALVGAVFSSARCLSDAASGDGSAAWTLP